MPVIDDPGRALLRFGRSDHFTAEMAWKHVAIIGGSGSGKTSTSGRLLCSTYLSAGWGMLGLCAKPEEAGLLEGLARAAGRGRSVIRFGADTAFRFDFLNYLMAHAARAGMVENAAHDLALVLEAAGGEAGGAAGGDGTAAFWKKASREALTRAFMLLWAAYGEVTIASLLELLQSRPLRASYADVPAQQPGQTSDDAQVRGAWHWQQTSFMAKTLELAQGAPVHRMDPHDFRTVFTYMTKTLANPDDKVTGNLIATLSADLAPLTQGKLRELFCSGTTNVVPEMCREGAALLMDLPLKVYGQGGLLAQHIMKLCWQRAAEREKGYGRPLALWMDEGHNFLGPYDAEFMSSARSSRVAVTLLTQSVSAIETRIGGRNPETTAREYLNNFATKIFHACAEPASQAYAADVVGKSLQLRENWGGNESLANNEGKGLNWDVANPNYFGGATGHNKNKGSSVSSGLSHGVSQQVDYILQPSHFGGLRTGGRAHKRRVDAILHSAGETWRTTGNRWLPLAFVQSR